MGKNIEYLEYGIAYDTSGNHNGIVPISYSGTENLPPITPNNFSGFNGDRYINLKVLSNISNAEIFLNGSDIHKSTPSEITQKLSDILTRRSVEITLQKQGYVSNEKYILSVIKNSDYFNGSNKTSGLQLGEQTIYSDTDPYMIVVRYFVNNVEQENSNFENIDSISFKLVAKSIDTKEDTFTDTNHTLVIVADVDSAVTIIKNPNSSNTSKIGLTKGINTISAVTGDVIRIVSSDLSNYRISNIDGTIKDGTKFKSIKANDTDSVATSITISADYNLTVLTKKVDTKPIDIPKIELNNTNVDRKYNINSKAGIPIGLTKSDNVSMVTTYINNTSYVFDNLGNDTNTTIVLPAKAFNKIGKYQINIVPSNSKGDGVITTITYNVVDDIYVGVPDIRTIKYPAEIVAPDYVGTDVDFEISYDSVNTDYVQLHIGSGRDFFRLNAKGKQILNFKKLLDLTTTENGSYSETNDLINLTLKLVPYNISGKDPVVGKTEIFTIQFDKGKLTIPRTTALNRILEAFEAQFNSIDEITPDDSSKYLTHLLHLGDGNNKVITTWTGSNDTLIVKLYEPLDTSIQPNQQVWISKVQSNPIIDTVTLVGVTEEFCPPLKGPNFSLNNSAGIGYKIFDELLASGSTTSTDLINKYTQQNGIDTVKLNIQYISGSEFVFSNFVNFGSAEERVNNFFYKMELIENYQNKHTSLTTSTNPLYTAWTSSISVSNEANKNLETINQIKRGFDGFEKFLYYDVSSSLAYPKDINNDTLPTTNISVISWYNNLVNISSEYDYNNKNYLPRNLPEFITENTDNADFITFLNMVGQHFDTLWAYINSVSNNKIVENKQIKGIANDMVYHMLKSFGWDGRKAYDSQFLWEYVFGTNKDGSLKYSMPLKDANDEVWRRILNNLPYLLKHKGTARAMKAIMACYGVPQSMLTIMEFGGPQNPTEGAVTKFTYDDRTAAISLDESSSIQIPWHVVDSTSQYPTSIELAFKPSEVTSKATLISGSEFTLDLIKTTGSFGTIELNFGGDVSTSTYFETTGPYYPYVNITYAWGPDLVTSSLDFPISTDYYSHLLINRTDIGSGKSQFDVYLNTSNGTRILTEVSLSITGSTSQWETGTDILIGGYGFIGELDEFRLWNTPLQVSKFNNHTLHPNAINGNHISASSDDLIFRLDFEYPKDVVSNPNIKNVSISTEYGEDYAYAHNFYISSSYPYQYQPYDRTVTADVPSVGFGYGNKIRFEDQKLTSELSYKVRATDKAFDRAPVDSNRLGLFFSPTKELNMDILKAFGDFNIDNYIGDPGDEYKDNYSELEKLRIYYFKRLNRNIYEYIRLIKYIDKSLFDVLHDLAPARANVSKGLLIEPHFLERSKTLWDKPSGDYKNIEADFEFQQFNELKAESLAQDAFIDETQAIDINVDYNDINALINEIKDYGINVTLPSYDTIIDYEFSGSLMGSLPMWDASIQTPVTSSVQGEVVLGYSEIGFDTDPEFGLYGKNSVSLVTTLDIHGNITKAREIVDKIKKSYVVNVLTQVAGYPTNGALPGEQVVYEDVAVTKYKSYVSMIPFYTASYGVPYAPSAGGTIALITPLNGYFPNHYKYKNNLGEGMKRSYWKGSLQDATTTPDGLDAVQTFTTNPNILKVANTGRGSGEPILEVD
jgi:hypothetical protein